MQLQNKTILIISPEGWGTNFVSKHHYAVELVKRGNTVFFLNPPGKSWDITTTKQGVHVVDYVPRFRGLGKLPAFIAAFLTKLEFSKLEQVVGEHIDVIWNFDSSRFFNLAQVKHRLKICHIVDMSENFQRDLLSATTDISFCTSDYIAKELKKNAKHVVKVHHGYQQPEVSHSAQRKIETFLPKQGRLCVGYVGNLSRACIDWDIIFDLIDRHPNIDFCFIGSYGVSNLAYKPINQDCLERLKKTDNVILLGKQPSYLIPAFLDHFDVLLCVYKMDRPEDYAQHSNLHKTMEYMGSGKPILTSFVDEYKVHKDLLYMSDKNKELPVLFNSLLTNLSKGNDELLAAKRKAFALDNTYVRQLDRIEKVLADF